MAFEIVLPPELLDFIFGYLQTNKASLAVCTQVSHRWHDVALPVLFRDHIFRPYRREGVVRYDDDLWNNGLDTFRGAIDHLPPPHLLRLVKHLEVDCIPPLTYKRDSGFMTAFHLDLIFPKFPALRSFTLRNAYLKVCRDVIDACGSPRNLDSLSLCNVEFDLDYEWDCQPTALKEINSPSSIYCQNCFAELLGMFAAIGTLSVIETWPPSMFPIICGWYHEDGITAQSIMQGQAARMRSNPAISKFITKGGFPNYSTVESSEVVLHLLSYSGALSNLKRLEIDEHLTNIQTVLLGAHSELESLRMVLSDCEPLLSSESSDGSTFADDRHPHDPSQSGIMWCSKLSSFHLVFFPLGSLMKAKGHSLADEADSYSLQKFLDIITYSPPSITTLLLEIQTGAKWTFQHLDFVVFDRLLSERSSLQKLEIIFAPRSSSLNVSVDDLEKVQAQLPLSKSTFGDRMAITRRLAELD
ncbi:hypothetical protein EIP91_000599 [Steccherinum ochraceum]|uniref:F-box domain-containing protein n=1 Tax=Steccherinum ochraceum TaxID=92696 RepID=A0A4V2MWP2_9APHY|nr:hypothetical protein EIP91_000599 [Steccherinum ochraceum]